MNIFSALFGVIDDILAQYLNGAVANAAEYITGPLATLAAITFILYGFVLLSGMTELPAASFIKKAGLLAIILTIGGSAANYNTYIADHLMGLPDDLMEVFAGVDATGGEVGDAASVGAVLDNIARRSMNGIGAIWQAGGWTDPGPALMATLLFAVFLLFGAAAAYAVAVMKIGLALTVALGPLMLLGLLHQSTREFFTRWLSYALQFAVLAGLIGGVAGIADAVVESYLAGLDNPGETINLVALASPALVLVLLAIIFSQLPGMASSITGGIGLGVGNLAARGMAAGAGFAAWQVAGKHMSAWSRAADRHRTDRASERQEQLRNLPGAALSRLRGGDRVSQGGGGAGSAADKGVASVKAPEKRMGGHGWTREQELERIRRRDENEEKGQ